MARCGSELKVYDFGFLGSMLNFGKRKCADGYFRSIHELAITELGTEDICWEILSTLMAGQINSWVVSIV